MYCHKCGHEVADDGVFCPQCGEKIVKTKKFTSHRERVNQPPSANAQATSANVPPTGTWQPGAPPSGYVPNGAGHVNGSAPPAGGQPQMPVYASEAPSAQNSQNTVKYVYVDQTTGRITKKPGVKSGSELFMQWMTIAFIAIGLVIVMIAGSMFISGYVVQNVFSGNVDAKAAEEFFLSSDAASEELPVVSDTPSDNPSIDVASEEDPPEISSEISSDVSSAAPSSVAPEMRADVMQKKIKGTWSTQIPYKAMSLPATFVFDGSGKCSCVLKAMFISKKFDGTYTIRDGGKCSITLLGLEDYVSDGNTMVGDLEFVSDNQMNFTVGDTIWILNRVE